MSIIADPATFIARITVSGLRGPTDDPIRTAFAVNGCPLQCQSESDVRPEKLSCCFWQVAGLSHSNDMHFLKIFRKVVHVQ